MFGAVHRLLHDKAPRRPSSRWAESLQPASC